MNPKFLVWMSLSVGLAACSTTAQVPPSERTGPTPTLPAPTARWIPTVNIAPARGWRTQERPQAAAGLDVSAFADGLDHPRWLLVLPNGDVLVAETNAPPKPAGGGLLAWITKQVMQRAGAGVPSANRITLLRDTDGDGRADVRSVFLKGLSSPLGMALVGDSLYVAQTDSIVRFPYTTGQLSIEAPGTHVTDLPAGPINHHWTKNLLASPDGQHLYVSVGSNSNVAEHGMAVEEGRAALWEVDTRDGRKTLFASGLRNPNGMAWEPHSGALWTVVNERDELGDDLVPDYLTRVERGAFYGWPYSYFGAHVDERVQPARPDLVARARMPDYALGAHVAALGLVGSTGSRLPAPFTEGMFIGEHGSWNRSTPSGYKVVFVPFKAGQPAGSPIDVLSGFLDERGDARGRPVGVAIDTRGGLLVADDVGNVVWRVAKRDATQAVTPGTSR